jgi:glycosyltransferase involved in cell wall biosynthesis
VTVHGGTLEVGFLEREDDGPGRDAAAKAPQVPPRIAFLYSEPSPYIVACWRELKDRYDAALLIVHFDANPEAPFVIDYDSLGQSVRRKGLSKRQIADHVFEFNPDGVFISGWLDWTYMAVAAECKRRGIPVILGLDTQWTGSLKQRLGSLTAPIWLRRSVSAIWTPGERQAQLAAHLGYTGANSWYGVYCCDLRRFNTPVHLRLESRESFLFVGRYVEEKGILDLVNAYRKYRASTEDPWPLYCAGTGPLRHLISEVEGIVDLGFIAPDALPSVMRKYGGVFILPSRVEPWGVVLQEAAAAGCPLICSDACGASVHLLQEGFNGLRFSAGKVDELARSMLRMSAAPPERLVQMGRASVALAEQFTPERWAQTIVEGIARSAAQLAPSIRGKLQRT